MLYVHSMIIMYFNLVLVECNYWFIGILFDFCNLTKYRLENFTEVAFLN